MSRREETNAVVQELERQIRDNEFTGLQSATFVAHTSLLKQIALSLADIADALNERREDV